MNSLLHLEGRHHLLHRLAAALPKRQCCQRRMLRNAAGTCSRWLMLGLCKLMTCAHTTCGEAISHVLMRKAPHLMCSGSGC